MTRELPNLKLSAIACEIPEGAHGFEVATELDGCVQLSYWYGENTDPNVMVIPPGEWALLGRCSKLNKFNINRLLNVTDPENFGVEMVEQWQQYCTANKLTNQIILVKR